VTLLTAAGSSKRADEVKPPRGQLAKNRLPQADTSGTSTEAALAAWGLRDRKPNPSRAPTIWKAAGRSVGRVVQRYFRQTRIRPEPAPASLLEFVPAPDGTTGTNAFSMPADSQPKVIRKQPRNKRLFPLRFDRKKRHIKTGGATRGNPVSSCRTPPVYLRVFLGHYHRLFPAMSVPRDLGLRHDCQSSTGNPQRKPKRRARLLSRAYFPVSVVVWSL
jgi:hypothetical protein